VGLDEGTQQNATKATIGNMGGIKGEICAE